MSTGAAKIRANARARSKARVKNRAFIIEAKSHPCMDCNGSFPPYVMDFDHIRGVKLFTIGRYCGKTRQQVLDEIAKCDVVCANCHRIRTQKDYTL